MNLKITFVFIISNITFIISQENQEVKSFGFTDDVRIEYDSPRSFINYYSEYSIDEHWFLRFEIQKRTYYSLTGSQSLLEYPLIVKYNFNNKFSVLFGPKIDVFLKDADIEDTWFSLTSGAQFNLNKTVLIEGRVNTSMGNELNSTNFNLGDGVTYKLGTRFKF
ncbi:hypothetical protein MBM09_07660 [Flaviramulus sp. BrNp1-15]|uniref:hypothetical protein n=1 Tax=Flaviramulus sp. BrNp1-15 TaxID=2916754 RepID=UPI001EE8CF62|nr:hypothetical protein [Flaviramulus sp. BrNp1-15]ULC60866.1 hypothetical protein MBM09_07660 [Flaviramulus sp. BrNp1-15]